MLKNNVFIELRKFILRIPILNTLFNFISKIYLTFYYLFLDIFTSHHNNKKQVKWKSDLYTIHDTYSKEEYDRTMFQNIYRNFYSFI